MATLEFAPHSEGQFLSDAEATVHEMVWAEVARASATPPARNWRNWFLLIASLGLFLAAGLIGLEPTLLAILAGVLVVHELGHFLAMKALGYRDVKLFFVPFFGAAVSGAKHAAPAWQRAAVLLLGPLPGLAAGAVLYLIAREPFYDGLGLVVLGLVLLNGMNLIPIEPFDGGKLAHLVIFSRSPSAELFFMVLAGVFLTGVGWLGGHWAIVFVAAVLLLGAWPRHVRAVRAAEVRRLRPRMSKDLGALNALDRLVLFRQAVRMTGGAGNSHKPWPNPGATAGVVRTLHEVVVTRPPSLVASAVALGLWAAGVAVTVGVVALWSSDRERAMCHPNQPGVFDRLAAPPPGGWGKTAANP